MNGDRSTQLAFGVLAGFGLGVLTAVALLHDRARRGGHSWLARVGSLPDRIAGDRARRNARAERRLMRDVERFRIGGL